MVRVYQTGSDGEPTNLDDCQEDNKAVAATVCLGNVWHWSWADGKGRMISSLRALKMAQSACIHLTHTHTIRCSLDVPCQFETLPSRQMVNGRP